MDRTIISLHEYRLRYPDSAEIPTLTQSGLLGPLLERQHQKAAKLAQRRAMWRSVFAAPRNVCAGIWRALAIPEVRHPAAEIDVAIRRHTLNP
jgi:hypothetical protein